MIWDQIICDWFRNIPLKHGVHDKQAHQNNVILKEVFLELLTKEQDKLHK